MVYQVGVRGFLVRILFTDAARFMLAARLRAR
jgi:hypothetical protein